ncbi:hypothetical protein C0995_011776 [Termitomyces sp. Mi166|nr:hypothetical protein C0995_011776 [Termitomyces sp. Mi166\
MPFPRCSQASSSPTSTLAHPHRLQSSPQGLYLTLTMTANAARRLGTSLKQLSFSRVCVGQNNLQHLFPVQIRDIIDENDEAGAQIVDQDHVQKWLTGCPGKLVGLIFIVDGNKYYVKDFSSSFEGGLAIQCDMGDEEDFIMDYTVSDFINLIGNTKAYWIGRG